MGSSIIVLQAAHDLMKEYYRIMLGQKSKFAQECLEGSYVGADFGIEQTLSYR